MDAEQFSRIIGCALPLARRWFEPMKAAMALFDISTPKRQAHFLAQVAHESLCLQRVAESFNYTPEALLKTFNTPARIRFTPQMAHRYGRTDDYPADQKMIASIAYANRLGNGGVNSMDGWIYRGRGPFMLTFKNNYRKAGGALGQDLEANPALVERPDIGSLTACWYWCEGNPTGRSMNHLADLGDVRAISRLVNGGYHGMDDRIARTKRAMELLA